MKHNSSFQIRYPLNECLCLFDDCLQIIFSEKRAGSVEECPKCAQYTTPKPTTAYDWSQLFQGDPPDQNNSHTFKSSAVKTDSEVVRFILF